MRSIFGDHTEADVKVFLLTANAIQYLAMVIFSPDANIFHPFHKVLYFVFQVQGTTAITTNDFAVNMADKHSIIRSITFG
jgi:hypothetical protein